MESVGGWSQQSIKREREREGARKADDAEEGLADDEATKTLWDDAAAADGFLPSQSFLPASPPFSSHLNPLPFHAEKLQ